MYSVVLVANGKLEIHGRPIPEAGEGEYLIKPVGVGVCSSDIFRGFSNGAYHYPLVMGHEISAQIVEPGPGAHKYSKGQSVVIFPLVPCGRCEACQAKRWVHCTAYDYYGSRRDGGFQDFLVVKEWNILPLPEGIDAFMASLCEPVSVCLHAANTLPLDGEGHKTAVIGAGFLGICTAMVLRDRPGYGDISLFDRNEFKLETVRRLGLNGINFQETDRYQKCFDYVIEACGAIPTYHASLKIAASRAIVVWMGNIQGDIEFKKSEISSILRKELTLCGTWNSEYQNGAHDEWGKALKLIQDASWLPSLISHKIPLESLPHMLATMYEVKKNHRPHNIFKVIVRF